MKYTPSHDTTILQDEPPILVQEGKTVFERINPPVGFKREPLDTTSFANYLRHLSLKPHGEKVLLYNGQLKSRQDVHVAVVDMDVGGKDLQQCADAIIRMRAEYLYSQKLYDQIHFNFTSGFNAEFSKWKDGYRIKVTGNDVSWRKLAAPSTNYQVFRQYLEKVFMYAGTRSLNQEMNTVSIEKATIGDVLIVGGSPGHAVIVVDECYHSGTGKKLYLLAQSYMPAQQVHILKNPTDQAISPWYSFPETGEIRTPEWTFSSDLLKGFQEK